MGGDVDLRLCNKATAGKSMQHLALDVVVVPSCTGILRWFDTEMRVVHTARLAELGVVGRRSEAAARAPGME